MLITSTSFINSHKQYNNLKLQDLRKYLLGALFKVVIISIDNTFYGPHIFQLTVNHFSPFYFSMS